MDKELKKVIISIIGVALLAIAVIRFCISGCCNSELLLYGSILVIGIVFIYIAAKIEID